MAPNLRLQKTSLLITQNNRIRQPSHNRSQPIGEVIDARTTPQGIWISAQIAPEATSARIDEAWALIRAGLFRGLSVGFIGRDWEQLSNGGRRFTQWEIVELSVVAVAANREAEIVEVKRLAEAQEQQEDQEEQEDESPFPRFPRSLSKADRNLLAHGASERWAAEIMEDAVKAGLKLSGIEKMLIKAHAGLLVHQRWASERIAELEGRANGR